MFCISHESQTFSSVGVKIWNALSIKIDVNVTLIKFKESLYPKYSKCPIVLLCFTFGCIILIMLYFKSYILVINQYYIYY